MIGRHSSAPGLGDLFMSWQNANCSGKKKDAVGLTLTDHPIHFLCADAFRFVTTAWGRPRGHLVEELKTIGSSLDLSQCFIDAEDDNDEFAVKPQYEWTQEHNHQTA